MLVLNRSKPQSKNHPTPALTTTLTLARLISWQASQLVCPVNSDSPLKSGYVKEIYTVMEIGHHVVKFWIDCGATINIITEALIANSVIAPTSKQLVTWNKTEITNTPMVLRNPKNWIKYSVKFIVVKENLTPLIGDSGQTHEANHGQSREFHHDVTSPLKASRSGSS